MLSGCYFERVNLIKRIDNLEGTCPRCFIISITVPVGVAAVSILVKTLPSVLGALGFFKVWCVVLTV